MHMGWVSYFAFTHEVGPTGRTWWYLVPDGRIRGSPTSLSDGSLSRSPFYLIFMKYSLIFYDIILQILSLNAVAATRERIVPTCFIWSVLSFVIGYVV